jgi:hypothetical protein
MCLSRKVAIFLILFLAGKAAKPQLIVDTTRTPTQLVQNILLGGNLEVLKLP